MGDWATSYDTQCEAEGLEVSPKKEPTSSSPSDMIRPGKPEPKAAGGSFGGDGAVGGSFGSSKPIGSGKMVTSPPPQTSFGSTSANRLPAAVGGSFGNSAPSGASAPDGRGAAIGSPEYKDDGPMGGNVISIAHHKTISQSKSACACTKSTNISFCRNPNCVHGNNRNVNRGSSGGGFISKPSSLPKPSSRFGSFSNNKLEETTKIDSSRNEVDATSDRIEQSSGSLETNCVGGGFGVSKISINEEKTTTVGGGFGTSSSFRAEKNDTTATGLQGSKTSDRGFESSRIPKPGFSTSSTSMGGGFGSSTKPAQNTIGGGFGGTSAVKPAAKYGTAFGCKQTEAGSRGSFVTQKQSSESTEEPQLTSSNSRKFAGPRYGHNVNKVPIENGKNTFNQKSEVEKSNIGGSFGGDTPRFNSAQKPFSTVDSSTVTERVLRAPSTIGGKFGSSQQSSEQSKHTSSSQNAEIHKNNTVGGGFGSSNYAAAPQKPIVGRSSEVANKTTNSTVGGGFGSSKNTSNEPILQNKYKQSSETCESSKIGGGFGSSKISSEAPKSKLGGTTIASTTVSDVEKPTGGGFGGFRNTSDKQHHFKNIEKSLPDSEVQNESTSFGRGSAARTETSFQSKQKNSFGNDPRYSDVQTKNNVGFNTSQSTESMKTPLGGGFGASRPSTATFGEKNTNYEQTVNSPWKNNVIGDSGPFKNQNQNAFQNVTKHEQNTFAPKTFNRSFGKESQSPHSLNYKEEVGNDVNDENKLCKTEGGYGGGFMGATNMRGEFQGEYRGGRGGGLSDFGSGQGQTHQMSSRGRGGHMSGMGRGMNEGKQFQSPPNYPNQGRSPFAPNNGFTNAQAPNQALRSDPKFRYVANKPDFDVHEKVPPPAEIALLNKYLHKEVEMMKDADVEVQRQDPKSPLYSLSSFKQLRLKSEILQALNDLGFEFPTRIQETALPLLLMEPPSNLIAQAQSGTGKTAAFVLTMLGRIDVSLKHPQCICLAPTLELAKQIGEVVEKMGKYITDLKIHYAIKGGNMALMRNHKLTEQIVIGTPGITRDYLMKYQCIDPSKIRCLVLDEADVMIYQQGFNDISTSIYNLIEESSPSVQSMLFSATYDAPVIDFATKLVKNAIVVMLKREEQALPNIKQFYVECANRDVKYAAIVNLYSGLTVASSVIFCHTKASVMWLCENMRSKGHMVDVLHGDMTVVERADVIIRFKQGIFRVLITTNVFARGIDVTQVSVVINYDLPIKYDEKSEPVMINNQIQPDCETYLHRIGRTGRFGKQGIAINFIDSPDSMAMIKILEDHFKMQIRRTDPSNIRDLEEIESST